MPTMKDPDFLEICNQLQYFKNTSMFLDAEVTLTLPSDIFDILQQETISPYYKSSPFRQTDKFTVYEVVIERQKHERKLTLEERVAILEKENARRQG